MLYFKHMANMRNDPKIRRLIAKYGLEGYGLYNLIVESIVDNLTAESPLPDLEYSAIDIAEFFNANSARVEEMTAYMMNEKLFEVNEISGRLLCQKVFKFLQSSQTRSETIRTLIKSYREHPQAFISDSLRQSMTLATRHSEKRKEKTRTEQKRTDEKREGEHTESEVEPISIDQLIAYWNEKGLPEYRYTSIQMATAHQIMDNCRQYAVDEIEAAIDTYADMLDNVQEYDFIPRYPTVASFLEKGIQAFFPGARPRDTFKSKKSPPGSRKIRERVVFFYRCTGCDTAFTTDIGNCPTCSKSKVLPLPEIKLFEAPEYPEDIHH